MLDKKIWLLGLGLGLALGSCAELNNEDDPKTEAGTTTETTTPEETNETSKDSSEQDTSGTLSVGEDVPVNITELSLGSLPTINEAGVSNPGTLALEASLNLGIFALQTQTGPTVGQPVDNTNIQSLFALECYWDLETDNWCPDEITKGLKDGTIPVYGGPNAGGDAPYWFSNFSILGIIHHAEAYFGGAYQKSDVANKIVPDSLKGFATKDYDGSAITRTEAKGYVIDIPNLYDSIYQATDGDEGMHYIFNSRAKEDGRYSSIPWAKFLESHDSYNQRNTGGGQSYLTMKEDGKTPHIYAINQVMSYSNSTNEGFRMILMINYETNHFLFKSGSTNSIGRYATVVAGKGGFDASTASWLDGAYYAQDLLDGSIGWEACVDNKTQNVLGTAVTQTQCQFVKAMFTEAETFDPAQFLQLTAGEKTDLVNFLAFFNDNSEIPASEIPGGGEDAASFPDEYTYTEAASSTQ